MNNKTKILNLNDYKFESKIKLYFSLSLISETDYKKLQNIFGKDFKKIFTSGIILPIDKYYITKNYLDRISIIYKKVDIMFTPNEIISLFRISEIVNILKEYLYENPNVNIYDEEEKNKFYEYLILKQIDKFPQFSTIRNFLRTCEDEEIDNAIKNLDSNMRYEYYKMFGKDEDNKTFIRSWNTKKDEILLSMLSYISNNRPPVKVSDILIKVDPKDELLKQNLFNYIRIKLNVNKSNKEIIEIIESLSINDIIFLKSIYGQSYDETGFVTNSQKFTAIIKKIDRKINNRNRNSNQENNSSLNNRKRTKEYYLKKYNISEELLFKVLENQPEKRKIYVKEYVFDDVPINDMIKRHKVSYQTIYTNVYEFEKNLEQAKEDDFVFRKTKPRYTKEMYMKENNINVYELIKAITYLPTKQKKIIKMYFGIECISKTIREIAKEEKHTQGTIIEYIRLAKDNIMKIIDSNYKIIIEEPEEPLEYTEEDLIKKYNISKEELLDYVNLLGDKQKWCIIYYLKLEKGLTKKDLKDKYAIDKKCYEWNISHAKKRLISLLDNKELDVINNKTELNTLLKELGVSKIDFFLSLETLSDYKIFCVKNYYGIDTNKLTLKEIADLKNKKDYNIRSNINKAKGEIKEIINSGKIYDIKLNKIRISLRQYLYENKDFKEKLKVLNYESSVALTLILDFNFKVSEVQTALGYNTKEQVITTLLDACMHANLKRNDIFKPFKIYSDSEISKADKDKMNGKS